MITDFYLNNYKDKHKDNHVKKIILPQGTHV